MKARSLQKYLQSQGMETDFVVHGDLDHLHVGLQHYPDLITVYLDNMSIHLSPFGTTTPHSPSERYGKQMLLIQSELMKLVVEGDLGSYLDGSDELLDSISVFYVLDGIVKEASIEDTSWPCISHDGYMLAGYRLFDSRFGALQYAVDCEQDACDRYQRQIKMHSDGLRKAMERVQDSNKRISHYQSEILSLPEVTQPQEGGTPEQRA
ncbi:hypothetical protein [Neptuniibacter sp. QD37_11]|uniref:hypothetical protein n=1 Tax=Neptuniibacter sp. QD37_11 TaxID=3398209 RepID=UPI0039F490C4